MKNIFSSVLIVLSLFPGITGYAQEGLHVTQIGNFGKSLVQQEFYNTGTLNYLLFMPEDTSAKIDGRFPLLVSLHGIGDRGNNLQLLKRDGLPEILDGYRTFPFIVLAPQCPETTEWYYDRTDKMTLKLISEIIDRYPVDPNRVYVTGYSMGGIGAYDLAIRYPEIFAAALPIAARGETYWTFCNMREVPAWAFHCNLDPLVPLHKAQFIVSVLQNCGCNIKFTVYNGVYHDSWSQTYENPEVYEWLLRHSKQKTRTVCRQDSLVIYGVDTTLHVTKARNLSENDVRLSLPENVISLIPAVISDKPGLIAGGEQHLQIIDFQSPDRLQISATIDAGGVCAGLAFADGILYVAAGTAGFKIYDLARPEAPVLLASLDTLANCESVTIDSSFAYIAAGAHSHILDISHPSAPMYLGKIRGFGGYHKFLTIHQNAAYICDSEQGVQIIDITDPLRPVNVNLVTTGAQTTHLMFQGNLAYVATGFTGLRIMDFTDVQNPREVSLLDTPGQALNSVLVTETTDETSAAHLFVADLTAGISRFEVTDPHHPEETGGISVRPPANAAYGVAYDLAIAENKAYLAYAENGLFIVDISRPEAPHLIGSFATTGNFRDVVVKENFAYVADIKTGLRVLDVSRPNQIAEVYSIPNFRAQELAQIENRLYLAAGDSGLIIFDLTHPAKPARTGVVASISARAVAGAENLLAISDFQKIYFFDVTDPAHPVQISETTALTRGNEGFVLSGTYAYVPDGDSLRIFDFTNLATPVPLGAVYTGGYGYEVAVDGNFAYVAADRKGLRVIDVSNVNRPQEAGYFEGGQLARGIAVDRNYIYVAEKENGLSVYYNDLIVGISKNRNDAPPVGFVLQQNFPNPFNPETNIGYELGDEMHVTLDIFNSMGQRLQTLVDARQPAGIHLVPFNAISLASGVYFYRLQAGQFCAMRKFVLLK
jgi:predicted esterase